MSTAALKLMSTKVQEFYKRNRTLDFEIMNDIFVNMMEEIIKGMRGSVSKHMMENITKAIEQQSNNLQMITQNVSSLVSENKVEIEKIKSINLEIVNTMVVRLLDTKKEIISDLRLLIEKHESDNIIKIVDKIEKETTKMLNDIVPRTNQQYYKQYEVMMKTFSEDIKKLNNVEEIEIRYNELLTLLEKSIVNYISSSETRINNNLSEIRTLSVQNTMIQDKMNNELTIYLDKMKNSSFKGQIAENQIELIINNLYPYGEIRRTTKESMTGDFIMTRENAVSILFEIKDYNKNIPTEEINKFIRDVKENNCCGIFLSISTGICKKRNFEIEILENNNILLYIHNMNYESDKIKIGVDIIDNLYNRLKLNETNDIKISTELLNIINKEYSIFIEKRNTTVEYIKETTKRSIQYIEDLELSALNNLLSSKFSFTNNNNLTCNICKKFVGTNAKSLAAHHRKCKIKPVISEEIDKKSSDTSSSEERKVITKTASNSDENKKKKKSTILVI